MRALPAVACLLAWGSCAPAQQPDAQQIWERVKETYAGAADYRARAKSHLQLGLFEVRSDEQHACKRPNKFHVRQAWRAIGYAGERTVVSDGGHLYERSALAKQYTKRPAPASVVAIEKMPGGVGAPVAGIVTPWKLFEGADLGDTVASVALKRMGRYRGAPVYVLDLALADGGSQLLWVGVDDYLIRKWTLRLGAEPSPVDTSADEADLDEVLDDLIRSVMSQQEGIDEPVVMRFFDVRISSGIPDRAFGFRLRPGETRVDELRPADFDVAELVLPELDGGRAREAGDGNGTWVELGATTSGLETRLTNGGR